MYTAPAIAGAFLCILVFMQILSSLHVQDVAGKGRGVFSTTDLAAGTTIEVSPVIVMSGEERKKLDETLLHDYIFEWEPEGQKLCCMAQGYISVYNHSDEANCEYYMHYKDEVIEIKTMKAVTAGEELCINYNGDFDDKKPVWFDTV